MKIKTVITIIREIKYVRSVLRKYSDSLACGNYYQHPCFRALSLNQPETQKKADVYFDKSGSGKRMKSVAEILNKIHFFKNTNKRSTEEYEAFYSANNYDKVREIKLFSFRNHKVLTICTSTDEMQKQIDQYEALNSAYNMPRVSKNNRYENAFEIAMVELKDYIGEKFAMQNIIFSTIAYNPSIEKISSDSVKDLVSFSSENEEESFYVEKIAKKIDPCLMSIMVPSCFQHGDLSKDNLLYGECCGKTDFWWIDWEHAKDRVFFYDLFFYIINTALYDDFAAFDCYINGNIDEAIGKLFSHFELTYDPKRRFDYLLIFMIPFLKERICFGNKIAALKNYFKMIENLEIRKKGAGL